jgi:hypothetical protein
VRRDGYRLCDDSQTMNKTILRAFLALFLVWAAIVANVRWPGMPPDGRWEFAIKSGERTSEVISLEDQMSGDNVDTNP